MAYYREGVVITPWRAPAYYDIWETEASMSQFDLGPVGTMLANWVEGAPHASTLSRRTRLRAYSRAGLNRYHLAMLLREVAFDLTLAGRTPLPDPADFQHLISDAPRRWEDRVLLGAELLRQLDERGVSVATDDRFEVEQAREAAAELLATMASASGDPDLKGVDWAAEQESDFYFGSA